jgi:signal transduction histidine kinase/ligand-binding sensor domain-containing protein
MVKWLTITILFLFFAKMVCFSQPENPQKQFKFEYLTIENGLSSNRNNCVFRDNNGFLWIGSEVGLDRFDGYTIKKYKNDKKRPHSLSNNSVHCIFEDSYKNLWIGTSDGLNLLNRDLDSFIVFKNIPADNNSLKGNNIYNIFEDSQKNLWIASSFGGLNKWNPKTGNFQRYQVPKNESENLVQVSHSMAEDSKGNLWVVSFSADLFLFHPKTGEFRNISDPEIDLGKNTKGLTIDKEDNLWIYTYGNGLFYYDTHTNKFTKIKTSADGTGTNLATICDVIQEDQTHILIGVDQGGINRFNTITRRFEYIVYKESESNGLNNNGIWSFYKDREGIFYITSSGGGVTYINPKKNKFKMFRHQSNNPKSLSFNFTGCFLEDYSGNVWIGTDGGGLNLFNPATKEFNVYKHSSNNPTSIGGNVIRCISADQKKDLWIATWDAGLIHFEQKTGKFFTYLTNQKDSNYITERIWFLKVAHNNVIWIGLYNGGIILFDKDKGILKRFRHLQGNSTSLSNDNIKYLYEDEKYNMWICTSKGLCRYDSINQNFIQIRDVDDTEIRTLYIDKTENKWVGTAENGLIQLDKNDHLAGHFTEDEGLSDNTIHAITEDNKGDLWISTNNSISQFVRNKRLFRNYSGSDGLEGNEFFNQSFLKARNGTLYFGGLNGFNTFHPDSLKDNPTVPQIIITDFLLLNTPSLVESEDHRLKHISACKTIVIHPWQTVFSFAFTATNFTYPENNEFAYKLDGFDKDWIYTNSKRRFVTYTNLNPGTYTFYVKGSNNDGVWNEKGVVLEVIILPPWWNTWWFKTAALAFVLLILTGFYFNRIKNFRNRQNELEIMVHHRTEEVEKLNEELISTNEELNHNNEELFSVNEALATQKKQLEDTLAMLKQTQIQLVQSEKMASIGVLTAGIAHEINNPINFISSGITGLEMVITDILAVMKEYTAHCEDITNCKRKNIVQEIEKKHDLSKSIENITTLLQSIQVGVDRTTNIVKSLRTFSRLDNESRSLTNVHELIDSSIAILGNKLKDRIVVVKEYKLTQPIECFPGKLSQVFLNLVMNAIQAIEKTGTITIISRKIVDMDKIEILIRDTGKGMSEEVQKRIFDPFYTTKPVGEGTGMGLSIVHGIIKDHNGEIVVTSKVGEGTEFKIVLPIT